MRPLILITLALAALAASADEPTYPLWDGKESIAEYAKRANLPPTKTLDLGNGVKLELVLIPAGKLVMGTEELVPLDEVGYWCDHDQPNTAQDQLVRYAVGQRRERRSRRYGPVSAPVAWTRA
jgi:hypothetical protein